MRASRTLGWLSLGMAACGIGFPFLVPLFVTSSGDFFSVNGTRFVWSFELIALIFGLLGRKSSEGKLGIAVSGVVSILVLGYVTVICQPTSFKFDSEVEVTDRDIGKILLALESLEVKGLSLKMKEGSFKTEIGGADVTFKLGRDVTLSSRRMEVAPTLSGRTGPHGQLLALDIESADLSVKGEFSVAYGKYPPVPITLLDLKLNSEQTATSAEATVEAHVAVRKLVAGILTHLIARPARKHQTPAGEPTLDAIVDTGSISEVTATLRDGADVRISDSFHGTLDAGGRLRLIGLSASVRDGQLTGKSDANLDLRFRQGLDLTVGDFTVSPKTLKIVVAGTISTENAATRFVLDQASGSGIHFDSTNVSAQSEHGGLSLSVAKFEAIFRRLEYTRGNDAQGAFDFSLCTNGNGEALWEQTSPARSAIAVKQFGFEKLTISSASGKPSEIATESPISLSGITVSHHAKDSTLSIDIPRFEIGAIASRSPSDVTCDASAIFPNATSIKFTRGKNSVTANIGRGFRLTVTGGKFTSKREGSVGLGELIAKGNVNDLVMAAGDQTLTSRACQIDLKATCGETIILSGGVTGFMALSSTDLNIPRAKLTVDSSSLTLDENGGILNGSVAVIASLSADDFASLVKNKIPAEFSLPKLDIRFNVTKTIEEEVVKRIPGGTLGKWAKKAFKVVTETVTRNVDMEVRTSFEDGRVRTNVRRVSFSGNTFHISAEPSISGKVTGKFGFRFSATFDLSGDVIAKFTEPRDVDGLSVVGEAHYNKFDIQLGGALKNVPGARQLKDVLTGLFTRGRGLKQYLPSKFEHRLFAPEVIQRNKNLQRLSDPRIVLKEKKQVVTLAISTSVK